MKRFVASALVLSLLSGFGFVGCSETTKEETTTTTSTPQGKEVETTTHEVKKSGDPAPVTAAPEPTPAVK